jgi:hypothetical protein
LWADLELKFVATKQISVRSRKFSILFLLFSRMSFASANLLAGKLATVGDISATLKNVGAKLGDTVQVFGSRHGFLLILIFA